MQGRFATGIGFASVRRFSNPPGGSDPDNLAFDFWEMKARAQTPGMEKNREAGRDVDTSARSIE